MEAITATLQGIPVDVPYTLDDMADDAAALIEALEMEKAHICGMSMGGMIAQTVAIRHPRRVSSLTSIYSTTGNPELPQPKPEIMQLLMTPPPTETARGHRVLGEAVQNHFRHGFPLRRSLDPGPGGAKIRPQFLPGRRRPTAGGIADPRQPETRAGLGSCPDPHRPTVTKTRSYHLKLEKTRRTPYKAPSS